MNNGLDISEEQFMQMNSLQRDLTMFRNMTHIRKQLKSYTFHRKVQYVWLSVLSAITLGLLGVRTWLM